MTARSNRKNYS